MLNPKYTDWEFNNGIDFSSGNVLQYTENVFDVCCSLDNLEYSEVDCIFTDSRITAEVEATKILSKVM